MRIFVVALIICAVAVSAGTIFFEVDQWLNGPPLINNDFMQRASKLQGDELTPQIFGIPARDMVIFRNPTTNNETTVCKNPEGKYTVTINNGLTEVRQVILNSREVNKLIDIRHFPDASTRANEKQKLSEFAKKIPNYGDQLFKAKKYVRQVCHCSTLPMLSYTSRETRYQLVQRTKQFGYPPSYGAKVQGKTLKLEGIPRSNFPTSKN